MTLRYTTNRITTNTDTNKANSIVELGASDMPPLDASNVFNIPGTGTVGLVTQRFDSYEPVAISLSGTSTLFSYAAEAGKLYVIDNQTTYGASVTFTITEAGFNQGDRFAILINRVTANYGSLGVTISVTGGSSGTASRVCHNGTCWSNATSPADTTMGPVLSGSLNLSQNLTQGDCFEFIRYNDGIRTGFFEKSHFSIFETVGGTTLQGNWSNFDNAYIPNTASTTGPRYTLAYDGTDWRWITTAQKTTAINYANGTTNILALPTNHQYMDQLTFFCTVATAPWSTGYTLNLTNFSSLPRNQIHMKPLIFLLSGSTNQQAQNTSATWPGYILNFSDTSSGVTIQQIYNTSVNNTSPFNQVNAIGIEDNNYGSSTAHNLTNAGIVIAFDWDNKRWYRIRKLIRGF